MRGITVGSPDDDIPPPYRIWRLNSNIWGNARQAFSRPLSRQCSSGFWLVGWKFRVVDGSSGPWAWSYDTVGDFCGSIIIVALMFVDGDDFPTIE